MAWLCACRVKGGALGTMRGSVFEACGIDGDPQTTAAGGPKASSSAQLDPQDSSIGSDFQHDTVAKLSASFPWRTPNRCDRVWHGESTDAETPPVVAHDTD